MRKIASAMLFFLLPFAISAQEILNLPVAKYAQIANAESNHCVIIHVAKPNVIEATIDLSQSAAEIDSILEKVIKDASEALIDQMMPDFQIWNHGDIINNRVPDTDREYGNALFVNFNNKPALLTAGHCFPAHESADTALNNDAALSMDKKYISKLPKDIILPDIGNIDIHKKDIEIVSYHAFGGEDFKKSSLKGKAWLLSQTDIEELIVQYYGINDDVDELRLALSSAGNLLQIKKALDKKVYVSDCKTVKEIANRIVLGMLAEEPEILSDINETIQDLLNEYVIRVPDNIFKYSSGHSGSGVVYNGKVVAIVVRKFDCGKYKFWILESFEALKNQY